MLPLKLKNLWPVSVRPTKLHRKNFHLFYSHEVEKFARNTGLKLFRTSVKENLNIGRVFQHLAERHIESVSRWSDESPDEFSQQPILQIGASHHHHNRDVRVRFANEHELNDNVNHHNHHNGHNNKGGIALYPRGFKPASYYKNNYHRKITNPFTKWTSSGNKSSQSRQPQNSDFYGHHPRYFHVHLHQQPPTPPQPSIKQACRMIWDLLFLLKLKQENSSHTVLSRKIV